MGVSPGAACSIAEPLLRWRPVGSAADQPWQLRAHLILPVNPCRNRRDACQRLGERVITDHRRHFAGSARRHQPYTCSARALVCRPLHCIIQLRRFAFLIFCARGGDMPAKALPRVMTPVAATRRMTSVQAWERPAPTGGKGRREKEFLILKTRASQSVTTWR